MTAPGPPRTTVTADDVQGLVVGDGNVVHQHFLGGITRLPTDYAQRVANFLVEYLGTPGRPVPFGGRRREAELLDAWLADPGAPPCLLLCAAAGQGKSALLVRWSRALLARGEAVAFVPASIRYRTNLAGVFFPALAARLAGFHGDEAPSDSHAPAEVWRGMVADYLARPLPDGRRLLVVLDGLDEAAGWEAGADLLPAAPPPGLRVVVSARTTAAVPTGADWLRTLGLDGPGRAASLPLSGLTEDDVLHLVGADAPGLARQLHRLSGGDPLLLSLYLRDGRPDDLTGLATTPPGLAGYFDRWWAEQRHLWRAQYGAFDALEVERRVGALMALFSHAAGPLDRDDLTALDPELPPHAITAAFAPLARFLLGDGRTYALAHSRRTPLPGRREPRLPARRGGPSQPTRRSLPVDRSVLGPAQELVPGDPWLRHTCVPLLARLTDLLPPELVVDKALPLLTHPALDDAPQHRDMFRTLVTPLPPSLQYTALHRLLTACEAKSRADTLAWISDLLPVLTRLGGPDTPERLFDVVEEITAAWP